ncbi:MAG: hypothetical protein M1603_00645 [Candidatus Marsarchaeota archaeon]|jgi:hypothetical protein|nr:hypothetical protein [Candidatus Marsarchaeota archaeon]
MTKVLAIVTSADKDKIELALGFSRRRKESGDDIRVLFFGPSEKMVAENAELQELVKKVSAVIPPKACIFVAQSSGVEDKLKSHMELLPAGKYITSSIDEGYAVISF